MLGEKSSDYPEYTSCEMSKLKQWSDKHLIAVDGPSQESKSFKSLMHGHDNLWAVWQLIQ